MKQRHNIIRNGGQEGSQNGSKIEGSRTSATSSQSKSLEIEAWVENSRKVKFDNVKGYNLKLNSGAESQKPHSSEENVNKRTVMKTSEVNNDRGRTSSNRLPTSTVNNSRRTLPWLRPEISEQEFHEITIASNNTSSRKLNLTKNQIHACSVISKELPSFSGDPLKWPQFITAYINSTQYCGFSDEENMA